MREEEELAPREQAEYVLSRKGREEKNSVKEMSRIGSTHFGGRFSS